MQFDYYFDLYKEKSFFTLKRELEANFSKIENDEGFLNLLAACELALGDVSASESYFRKALQINHLSYDALYNLGLIKKKMSLQDEALHFFQKANAINPQNKVGIYELASSYAATGDVDLSIRTFQLLLTGGKQDIRVLRSIAQVYLSNNQFYSAETILDQLCDLDKDNHLYFELRGLSKRQRGLLKEAVSDYEYALRLQPKNNDLMLSLGKVYYKLGRFDRSLKILKCISEKNNYEAELHIAHCHEKLNNLIEAEEILKELSDKRKDELGVFEGFCELSAKLNKPNLLIKHTNRFSTQFLNRSEAKLLLARAKRLLNKPQDAISLLKGALTDYPQDLQILKELAMYYYEVGKNLDAKELYKIIIKLYPNELDSYRNLATIDPWELKETEVDRMLALSKSDHLTLKQRADLYYSLFKVFDRDKDGVQAFAALKKANQIKLKLLSNTFLNNKKSVERSVSLVRDVYLMTKPLKEAEIQPVFIVGLPRSGSTLIEDKLASQLGIYAGGELKLFQQAFQQALNQDEGSLDLKFVQSSYVDVGKRICTPDKILTDKMPFNFIYIPIIKRLFPNALIIHIFRNAQATMWSNFSHFFAEDGIEYSYNLNHLMQFYELYKSIMLEWSNMLGAQIFHLSYEDFIERPDFFITNICDELGVKFKQSSNLEHANLRQIKTASASQVRQKIFHNGNEKWKSYQHLLPASFNQVETFRLIKH